MYNSMNLEHKLCEHEVCGLGFLEHTRFFPRQIVTDGDLTLEHQFWRDKFRRHNRFLHGWGVVCGAKVCLPSTCDGLSIEPWKVTIEPGYILGPCGDEIVIDQPQIIDLRKRGAVKTTGESCGEVSDPWCSDVYVSTAPTRIYVAVRYKEVLCRPVRIQPIGCGCDDTPCEYSRIRDGYEVGFLCDCPDSQKPRNEHRNGNLHTNKDEKYANYRIPDCTCPTDSWVVLAAVDLDDKGTIISIDNCACRRLVKSLASEVLHCRRCPDVVVETPKPTELHHPGDTITVRLEGTGLERPAHIRAGAGVSWDGTAEVKEEGKKLQFELEVEKDAKPGPRRITVQYPCCCFTTFEITICEPEKPSNY